MNSRTEKRLKKISGGIQTGVTSFHVLIAVILLIASMATLIYIIPGYNKFHDNEADEEKDDDNILGKALGSIGQALSELFLFGSILGIVIGANVLGLSSYSLVGDIKNIRGKTKTRTMRSSYITGSIDLLIIIILLLLNYGLFHDDKTGFVFNLMIGFWFLLFLIALSNIIINATLKNER